tara:strand:- start:4459 stop:4962 length:504 start_codon:yes stop_codon:yes gene_type:complete
MKKIILALFVIAAGCSPAAAESVQATITYVEPRYETSWQDVPQNRCETVQVPIYGTVQGGGASGGDVLTGMIIGGLLGKGLTGKDNGAAAGAVLGGVISADKNNQQRVITGYQNQQQCYTSYNRQKVQTLKNYFIRFEYNGMQGTAYTYNNYQVGQRIPVSIQLRAD